jgi:hypothetical protein
MKNWLVSLCVAAKAMKVVMSVQVVVSLAIGWLKIKALENGWSRLRLRVLKAEQNKSKQLCILKAWSNTDLFLTL